MKRKKVRLGITDWDGSLFGSFADEYNAARHVFRTAAPHLPPPLLEDYRNGSFPSFYRDRGIPATVTDKTILELRSEWLSQCSREEMIKGAMELLAFCGNRQLPMAIVSGNPGPDDFFAARLVRKNIRHYFDYIRLQCWPKAEALVETLDYFGVKAEEAFYLDDTHEGITAAKQLGIITIGHTGGYNSPQRVAEAKPDFLADSLFEVIDILKNKFSF